MARLRQRWTSEGGYRELLSVAIPLILSTSAWSIQHFVDRMFLSWYSAEAIAAAMPAGILNFTVMSLFIGTAGYVSTFVAQYHGSGQPNRIGPVVWQGVHLALIGAAAHLCLIPAAPALFRFFGHAPAVRELEVVYFRILCTGAGPAIAAAAMSGFFSGLGRTWPVMWVSMGATALNLALDYALIFGRWHLPRLGMAGAAIATVVSAVFSCLVYTGLLLRRRHARTYHTTRIRIETRLFARLMRFGLPSGVQFFVDVAGFALFVLLVGRLGTEALAATNIAFNINTLAFMPMIGIGIALSVLVGQRLGEDRPDLAERTTWSGLHLTSLYMTTIALLYLLRPDLFVRPFARHADAAAFAVIRPLATVLLRFVAVYSLFDALNIVFASTLKGAGDTRYVMRAILVVSAGLLVLPAFVAIEWCGAGIYAAWTIVSAYVIMLGFVFYTRFRTGKWKSMRVVEPVSAFVPPGVPESPGPELGT
ncbi:MAG: MATE family efflux transporter [Kiritimatiellae bacterium]|nr:MATE family efflux transporter [Kiritimatiellia bacterium]